MSGQSKPTRGERIHCLLVRWADPIPVQAAAAEIFSLARAVQDESLGLERKFEARVDALVLSVTDKMDSFQNAVNQRLEEQVLQFRGLEPTSASEFKVRSFHTWVIG